MPFLRSGTAKVFYQAWSEGERPWVALINGFTRDSNDLIGMARTLSRGGFNVFVLDNRGAGQTEVSEPFTIADTARDYAAVARSLGIKSFGIVGISYGGWIGVEICRQIPQSIAQVILVTVPWEPSENSWNVGYQDGVTPNPDFFFSENFRSQNSIIYRALVNQMRLISENSRVREGAIQQRNSLKDWSLESALEAIKIPVHYLYAENDRVAVPAVVDKFRKLIPAMTEDSLGGVGHLVLAEAPKLLYQKVIDFFIGNIS